MKVSEVLFLHYIVCKINGSGYYHKGNPGLGRRGSGPRHDPSLPHEKKYHKSIYHKGDKPKKKEGQAKVPQGDIGNLGIWNLAGNRIVFRELGVAFPFMRQ